MSCIMVYRYLHWVCTDYFAYRQGLHDLHDVVTVHALCTPTH